MLAPSRCLQRNDDFQSSMSLRLSHEIERIETENAGNMDIAQSETRAIMWLKVFVLCLLLTIASVMTWLAYSFTAQQENSNFETTFENQATRLIHTFHERMVHLLVTGSGLSVSLAGISSELSMGTSFNITWASFEQTVNTPLDLVQATSISWAPVLQTEEERLQWEAYAIQAQHVANYTTSDGTNLNVTGVVHDWEGRYIEDGIVDFDGTMSPTRSESGPPYSPIWQSAPIANTRPSVMLNQISEPVRAAAIKRMTDTGRSVFSGFLDAAFEQRITTGYGGQQSILFTPLYNSDELQGSIQLTFDWSTILANGIGEPYPMPVVLHNSCGGIVTYTVTGHTVQYLGEGDLHNATHKNYEQASSFETMKELWLARFGRSGQTGTPVANYFQSEGRDEVCSYKIRVYPGDDFVTQFYTCRPAIYAVAVALVFSVCVLCVYVYNLLVERRQKKVMTQAVEASSIVDSMFPSAFRDRLFGNRSGVEDATGFFAKVAPPKIRLTTMLSSIVANSDERNSRSRGSYSLSILNRLEEPIAEVFSSTTVIFADIAGFTAWSSEREPSQVFELLETLYRNFDIVAKRLGVFKVETIGDCYVAVTGLPEFTNDHAIICARFAWEVLHQMSNLTKALEVSLGPGTSDLNLRIGLHSGSVTAGVLRGDKARFQLFGDTMNTASRMESTGQAGKIQVSAETAGLLTAAGKRRWLSKREKLVAVKGKGDMQTFWLEPRRATPRPASLNFIGDDASALPDTSAVIHDISWNWEDLGLHSPINLQVKDKLERLVDWNVEVLISRLAKVVAKRDKAALVGDVSHHGRNIDNAVDRQPFEAVSEVIELPRFDPRIARRQSLTTANTNAINQAVRSQLRAYVARIASYYKDVPFHNFEHASHVALSANKLIKRIIAPEDVDYKKDGTNNRERMESLASDLHHSTFGISSDPLTHFVVVFAALVHDVDHTGVPNAQLVKEEDPIAVRYGNKSVAEQNSVQLALETLAEPQYKDLQCCIYADDYERSRFRQLLINSVMATDIVDRELHSLRKNRWAKAFHDANSSRTMEEDVNRKATIVIEHIIQASDVAHTMQHWHVFCKWNEKLYQEMYGAFLSGRSNKDPSTDWYESEIGFFDHYIIPLARKLKECGVFGVSSDEYLQYALANRQEWAIKGRQVTNEMIIRHRDSSGDEPGTAT